MLRDLGPAGALPKMATILSRRDAFVAVDIAGNEAGFPAGDFAAAYARAAEAGLRLTAHAGEAAGRESGRAAVRERGVERVGHGVRSAERPCLMDPLAELLSPLEVALTSNVQT